MGEIRSTFESSSTQPEKLRSTFGKVETGAKANLSVGQTLVQRDSGEAWQIIDIKPVESGPMTGEQLVQMQDTNGNKFNTHLGRLEEILSTEGGAWKRPEVT